LQRSTAQSATIVAMVVHSPFRAIGLTIAATLVAAVPVAAQRTENGRAAPVAQRGSRSDPSPSPQTADTQNRPPPGLLGDFGGVRPYLRDRGVELTLRYASESAYNPSGGERHLYRETGQFDLGATIDMERLAQISGGTFQAPVTYRRGHDLGADAGLGVLQQVQEVRPRPDVAAHAVLVRTGVRRGAAEGRAQFAGRGLRGLLLPFPEPQLLRIAAGQPGGRLLV
jgi:hypothetical protein